MIAFVPSNAIPAKYGSALIGIGSPGFNLVMSIPLEIGQVVIHPLIRVLV